MQSRFAQPCVLCAARSRAGRVCPACLASLPRLPAARCPRCAAPGLAGAVCGACLRRAPAFDRAEASFVYADPVDLLIQRFKYDGETGLADLLAARPWGDAAPPEVDLLIPMPLHPDRLRERGYNQAALLATRLGRGLGLMPALDLCRRTRPTAPQAGQPGKARRRNVRGAFACDHDLGGRRVLLVDDVMTSGASLDELARTVKAAGAIGVSAWVAARAVND
ncbi:MAG: ComF family protein [Pseudomonadota bacterium]